MTHRDDKTQEGGRATAVEVVSYTAVIALVGAVAAGWFDTMVPWL
ncbi:hypothetical protein [Sanguibacter suaedae]|nr:hypothetical protein [Sanguibacter suaedae]